jgi:hypothetical protein
MTSLLVALQIGVRPRRPAVYPTARVDVDRMPYLICAQMFTSFLVVVVFSTRTRKDLDRIQGVTAAVSLEVKRTLREYHSNP